MNVYDISVNGQEWYIEASRYGVAVRRAVAAYGEETPGFEGSAGIRVSARKVASNTTLEKWKSRPMHEDEIGF